MKKSTSVLLIALSLMLSCCAASMTQIGREGATAAAAGQKSENGKGSGVFSGGNGKGIPTAKVSQYIDSHERDIGQRLPQSEETYVVREGDNLLLTVKSDILFNIDSSQIKAEASGVLRHVTEVVNKYIDTKLVISGYTDSSGSEQHNLKLSEARALAVKKALETGKVAPQRMTTTGYGESKPIATNATELGRQSNRRVTIEIIPIKAP
jgi:outer membrane protein OmpA-like peptidoglycan-associated protein